MLLEQTQISLCSEFFFKEKFSIELNLCKGADQRDLMLCLVIINEFSGWVRIIFIINILVLEKFYFISNDICFKLKSANLIINFNFFLETQTKAILIENLSMVSL